MMRFEPDGSFDNELAEFRVGLLEAGLAHLKGREDEAAMRLKPFILPKNAYPTPVIIRVKRPVSIICDGKP